MDTVILRTGSEVPRVLVATMHLVCSDMMDMNPLAMFDAISMARDSSYEPFGNSGQVLRDAAILDCTGKLCTDVSDILCAIFEGDVQQMRLLGPGEYLKQ